MRHMVRLVVAVLGWLAVASVWAGDATEVLTSLREAFGKDPCNPKFTLTRRGGTWGLASASLYMSKGLSVAELDLLSGARTLEELKLGAKVSVDHLQRLSALPQLRRFTPCAWGDGLDEAVLKALSEMASLEDLNLGSHRNLSGQYLLALGRLPNLQRLDLSSIQVDDETIMECIRPLKVLQELVLTSDRITDRGVSSLKELPHLRSLSLRFRVGAAGLETLTNSKELETLWIGEYDLASGKGDLSGLRNLKSLRIGRILGGQAGKVALPANLRRLQVDGKTAARLDLRRVERLECVETNAQEEPGAPGTAFWFCTLPALRELDLWGAGNADVKNIARLHSLQSLRIHPADASPGLWGVNPAARPLEEEGLQALRGMQQLSSLRMGDLEPWGIPSDAGMEVLSHLPALRELGIGCGRGVTARGIKYIGELKQLTSLELDLLYSDDVIVEGLADLGELKQLRVLHLRVGRVRERGSILEGLLPRIGVLSELEDLSTSGVLTDKGLEQLAGLKKLRRLDLTWNSGFTDAGLAALMTALPALEEVKLSYRQLPKLVDRKPPTNTKTP